jgi:hypothetical protein
LAVTLRAALRPTGPWPTSDMWDSGDAGTSSTHSAQSRTADTAPYAHRVGPYDRQGWRRSPSAGLQRPHGSAGRSCQKGGSCRRLTTLAGPRLAGGCPRHGDSPRWQAWPHSVAPLGRPSATPSRSNGLWTLARGRRVMWRDRVVVSLVRWPSRSWMVCRPTPASHRCVAKQCRNVGQLAALVIPARRRAALTARGRTRGAT